MSGGHEPAILPHEQGMRGASALPRSDAGLSRDRNALGLDHHVGSPGAVEGRVGAIQQGVGIAGGEDAFVVGGLDPVEVPIPWGNIDEDICSRWWLIARAVHDPQEEDTAFGPGVQPVGAVGERARQAAGCEAVGPKAFDPSETPIREGHVDKRG